MNLIAVASLIGLGYFIRDNKSHQPIINRCYTSREYSISETIKKNICNEIDRIFDDYRNRKPENGKHSGRYPWKSSNTLRACLWDKISFDSYNEARNVLDRMNNHINRFGTVSISDFYLYSGISYPPEYEEFYNKFGWYNLANAKLEMRMDRRWHINFPSVTRIEMDPDEYPREDEGEEDYDEYEL